MENEQKMHINPHCLFSISVIWCRFPPQETIKHNYGQAISDNSSKKHISFVFHTVPLEVIDNWYLTTWKHFLIWSRCRFNRHASQTEQQSPPWCDHTCDLVIATLRSGTHSVIKWCCSISDVTHRLCMKFMGEGKGHTRRLSDISRCGRVNDSSRWDSVQHRTRINTLSLFKK